jgi:hypothetical protein
MTSYIESSSICCPPFLKGRWGDFFHGNALLNFLDSSFHGCKHHFRRNEVHAVR